MRRRYVIGKKQDDSLIDNQLQLECIYNYHCTNGKYPSVPLLSRINYEKRHGLALNLHTM